MKNENLTKTKIEISKLAYEYAKIAESENTPETQTILREKLLELKELMSNFPIKDQYDMVLHLQNPNNVNGAQPAKEYTPVRDSFMQNLVDHYSTHVTFLGDFEKQTASFSSDQLTSLQSAINTAIREGIPANKDLNQNGINNTINTFRDYIKSINDRLPSFEDEHQK